LLLFKIASNCPGFIFNVCGVLLKPAYEFKVSNCFPKEKIDL
jgi:hypothetical protein